MSYRRQELGQLGESLAEGFLRRHGYRILVKNFRTRYGEIDLIAQESGTLCFVEVKTRRNFQYGSGLEAVSFTKRKKLARMALTYMSQHPWTAKARFDVIAITATDSGEPCIELVKHAFELTD